MNPRHETFTVIFGMFRNVYEDVQIRDQVAKNVWLTGLQGFNGTPHDINEVHIVQAIKFLGPLPVEDDDVFWDHVRVSVQGPAYRADRQEEIGALARPLDDALEALTYTMTQYVAEHPYHYCTCPSCTFPDEDDLDTNIPTRALDDDFVPLREDYLGEDPEADKYPWTDPATWYREYADED